MSPATYTFSKELSFSSNHTAGCLVATIPVIAVGFLGLAVATFLFIVRKLDFALGLVCGSAFLEFLAALFDVSQILVRGAADESVTSSTVTSLMLARDIFFSFGGGLRFFAFWAIVAQRPWGEAPITQRDKTSENFLAIDPSMHSGNWMRWGVVGILLKWVTAAIAVAITLMQILWRAVNEFDNLGPVYAAENGLEVVMSVVFIIKLCLNAAITDTPSRSRWMTLVDYMPLIVALLFNFALGIGNIAVFPFSESTAGRLMIATELYIVIETLLCWKFYGAAGPQATPNEKTDPVLNAVQRPNNLGRSSTFLQVPQYTNPLARISDSGQRIASWVQQPRPSWAQRLSSISGRFRPALARDEARLYNPQDAERGQSPTTTENGATYDLSPSEARQSARYPDPMYTSFFQDSQRDIGALDQRPARAISVSDSGLGSQIRTSRTSSYYDRRENDGQSLIIPPPIAVTSGSGSTRSPIYGLNGTLRADGFSPVTTTATYSPMMKTLETAAPPSFVDSPTSLVPPRSIRDDVESSSARSSGYNQLLREQDELEKSIAQLRLFSRSQNLDSVVFDTRSFSPESGRPGLGREQSDSSGSDPLKSASLRSVFSLSVFPEPPLARRSSQVRPQSLEEFMDNASTVMPTRDHTRQNSNDSRINVDIERATMDFRDAKLAYRDSAIDLLPPRMPAVADELSQTVPSSTRTSEDNTEFQLPKSRLDSNGTQYDVTSFIGTLTIPSHKKANSSLSVITNAIMSPKQPQADEESETMSPAASDVSARIMAVERRPSDAQAARAIRLEGNGPKEALTSVPAPAAPRVITIPPRSQSADDTDGSFKPASASESPAGSPTEGRVSPTSSGRRVEFGRTPSGRKAGLPARPRMVNSSASIEEEVASVRSQGSGVQPPF
ncbi:hypothetical protein PENSPDRAFT_3022 [Peniophora sp. CONT]|nr:hypothetical protein PENSPDRAFT_3022 [Peniophora sp. CONT]